MAKSLSTASLRHTGFAFDHPYSGDTRWPRDFPAEAAIAAGALPNLPGENAWPPPHPDQRQEPPPPTEDGDS